MLVCSIQNTPEQMTEKFYRGRSEFGAQIAYIIFF